MTRFQFSELTEEEIQLVKQKSREIIDDIKLNEGWTLKEIFKEGDDGDAFIEEVANELADIEFFEERRQKQPVMVGISKSIPASQYKIIDDFYTALDNLESSLSALLANQESVSKINGVIQASNSPEAIHEIGFHKNGKKLNQLVSAMKALNNQKIRRTLLSHKKGRGKPASSWFEIRKCQKVIEGIKKYLPSVEVSANSVTHCNTLVSIFVKRSSQVDSKRLIELALKEIESPSTSPWRMLR
ncbi:hypothetical protein [Thiothrix nivea]|uniref:Uncharacterized protein n=1 Tax=Thiothrix nivea (strain ATCC 35100 / DSM 5205 / JP2) TaxID=870187 RepID=A0A656HGA2_THINJ|nr:hypothetical protein [Thiothrix nivea]EIJ34526.1 hypothetical protein Thini_1950 [Thiothrix nivea DSM 5205]